MDRYNHVPGLCLQLSDSCINVCLACIKFTLDMSQTYTQPDVIVSPLNVR